jgi:hypothetical protein
MPMTTLVALYRGETIGDARLIAVSADPELVAYVAAALLQEPPSSDDPVVAQIDGGQRRALRLVKKGGMPRPQR